MTTFLSSFCLVLITCFGVLYAAVVADQVSVRASAAIAFLMGCLCGLGALAVVSELNWSMAGSASALAAFAAVYLKYIAEDRSPQLYFGWRSPN
jgi:hypothetical protein